MKRFLIILMLLAGLVINTNILTVFAMDTSSDEVSNVSSGEESTDNSHNVASEIASVEDSLRFICKWKDCHHAEIIGKKLFEEHLQTHLTSVPLICLILVERDVFSNEHRRIECCNETLVKRLNQPFDKKNIITHIMNFHYGRKIKEQFKCPFCHFPTAKGEFLSIPHFHEHAALNKVTIASNNKSWKCIDHECKRKESNSGSTLVGLLDHIKLHHIAAEPSQFTLQCRWFDDGDDESTRCAQNFHDDLSLKKHVGEQHCSKGSSFVCKFKSRLGLCGRVLETKKDLILHISKSHILKQKNRENVCPFCNELFLIGTLPHIKEVHGDAYITISDNCRQWVCNREGCSGKVHGGTIKGLRMHVESHRGNDDKRGIGGCRWSGCNASFSDRWQLKGHIYENHCNNEEDGKISCGWIIQKTGKQCNKLVSYEKMPNHIEQNHLVEHCPVCKNFEGFNNVKYNFYHICDKHNFVKLSSQVLLNYRCKDHDRYFSYVSRNALQRNRCLSDIFKHLADSHNEQGSATQEDPAEVVSEEEREDGSLSMVSGSISDEESYSQEDLAVTLTCGKCREEFSGYDESVVKNVLADHMRDEHNVHKKHRRTIESDDELEFEEQDLLVNQVRLAEKLLPGGNPMSHKISRPKEQCVICNSSISHTIKDHILHKHAFDCFICRDDEFKGKATVEMASQDGYERHIQEKHPEYCYVCFKKHSGDFAAHLKYRHPEKVQEHLAAEQQKIEKAQNQPAQAAVEKPQEPRKMSFKEYMERKKAQQAEAAE